MLFRMTFEFLNLYISTQRSNDMKCTKRETDIFLGKEEDLYVKSYKMYITDVSVWIIEMLDCFIDNLSKFVLKCQRR